MSDPVAAAKSTDPNASAHTYEALAARIRGPPRDHRHHRPGIRRPTAGPCILRRGFGVIGFDIDQQKIDKLHRGESYIRHIPAETIREMRQTGSTPRTISGGWARPIAVIICVPTPLTDAREPDLTYIVNSARSIAATLRRGQLVVLESTTYPGPRGSGTCRSSKKPA